MNDAENLSKLLGHLPPAVFRSFMAAKFSLEMPDLDKKAAKKDQRAGMEAVLAALDVSDSQSVRACTVDLPQRRGSVRGGAQRTSG